MPQYSLHGLRILTSDPLPGVAAEGFSGVPDCVVLFAAPPRALDEHFLDGSRELVVAYEPEVAGPDATLTATAGDGWFRLRFWDGAEGTVDREGSEVWMRSGSTGFSGAATHLLGQVIGFALRLRGRVSLHAGCAIVSGRAVAFAGPSSAGKSTLAAALAARGDVVLSDNITTLREEDGTFLAFPGPHRFLLADDAAAAIYGDASRFPIVSATSEKRLVAATPAVEREARPLAAVFILDRAGHPIPDPVVERLDPKDALIALLANSYGSVFFTPAMRAADLDVLTRLAHALPVFYLFLPKDFAALPRAIEAMSHCE